MNRKGLRMAKGWVKWFLPFYLFTFLPFNSGAQRILSLDSCRQMALNNNKQLGVSKLKQGVAANLRKSARTKYLPHVSAIGTYEFTSEPISLLSETQKAEFGSLGTALGSGITQSLGPMMQQEPKLAAGMVWGRRLWMLSIQIPAIYLPAPSC